MSKIIDLSLYRNSNPFTTKSSALSSLKTQLGTAKDGSIILVRYYAVDGNTNSDIKTIFGFAYNNASKKYYSIYDLDEVTNTCKKYTDQAIDNIKIGGRNLLYDSDFKRGLNHYDSRSDISSNKPIISIDNYALKAEFPSKGATGTDIAAHLTIGTCDPNTKYTLSGFIKCDKPNVFVGRLGFGASENMVDVSTSYKYFSMDVLSGSQGYSSVFMYITNPGIMWLKNLKFEQGNIPTAWTPAPEDKQDKLISGTNIKTIKGQSILGSGDISIVGPTGPKGEPGINATITNATASVGSTVGTPSVKVSLGGTPSARTFDFAFSNLKGATGVQGPQGDVGPQGPQGLKGDTGVNATITGATATVDSTIGTPKVTVTTNGTPSERTFAFNFTGLKGATGAQGPQGPAGPGLPLVQDIGQSTTSAMSQKAVTDALSIIDGGTF